MADQGGNTLTRLAKAEHVGSSDTGDNVEAKRVVDYIWDGSNWQRMVQPSSSSGLTDAQLRATPVPVTANAGTNLNTSALALESTLTSIKDTAGIKKITDALPTGTNQIGSIVPDRPSQGTGRVYKTGQIDAITADTQVYAVTAAKTLYITSWGLSFHNSSTIGMGHIRLRDGDATGAIIASWVLPTAVAGLTVPHSALDSQMQEPRQFTNAVFIDVVTGTITVSFQFTGYES